MRFAQKFDTLLAGWLVALAFLHGAEGNWGWAAFSAFVYLVLLAWSAFFERRLANEDGRRERGR